MNVNKSGLNIIDQIRIKLRLSGGNVVSREEMLMLLLRRGEQGLTTDELKCRRERGVICITPECRALPGLAVMPAAYELATMLKGNAPSFTAVFGALGSGVTIFMNQVSQILRNSNADITLFDAGPNAVNIHQGMSCFEQGGKALVAVSADTYDEAVKQISFYSSTSWLNSREFKMLAQHHRLETVSTATELQ
ncbi:hypothetical protein [Erwinia sp. MYb416]|uniref:hypothetical protein n=1 Tax=Erwinia sp. MYb416 TaxID=3108532 RepID=UPI003095CA9B